MSEQTPEVTSELKYEDATHLIKNYMWWSMGAGLIPVPLVDLAAVSGTQIKLIKSLADLYGVEFSEHRSKSIISALLGSVVPNSLSYGMLGSIVKAVPIIGTIGGSVSMALFSGAATYAIGQVFNQHFNAGGTLLDFDPVSVNDFFKQKFEEGKEEAKKMKETKE